MNNTALWEKEDVVKEITLQHKNFKETISALNQNKFDFSWNEKWTPGQQLEHIRKICISSRISNSITAFFNKVSIWCH